MRFLESSKPVPESPSPIPAAHDLQGGHASEDRLLYARVSTLGPECSPSHGRPDQSQPPLPYSRQSISEEDIQAVVEVLRSDWLTTGPALGRFEQALATYVDTKHAVAVSSGTAALHAAMFALGIGPGDEVIVPALTFVATSNCVVYQGGTPVFADVDPSTLLLDAGSVQARLTPRTKAIIAVDYAGQPCDYDALRSLARQHGLALVADASHALGADLRGQRTGGLADLTTFSFHPVKPITTAEGGAVTTDDEQLAARCRQFRNHGIGQDHHQRARAGSWRYQMTDLGYNYRLNDLQAALGLSQLRRLDAWTARRREIAQHYDRGLQSLAGVRPLRLGAQAGHAYHLYVVRIDARPGARDEVFSLLRRAGIGVNVHYGPVHLHPFYRERFGTGPGMCPVAEAAAEEILSLPLFPAMTEADADRVLDSLKEALAALDVSASAHRRPAAWMRNRVTHGSVLRTD